MAQATSPAGREPITSKLVADLLKTAGADRVVLVDLHAEQIVGFFDKPMLVDHLYANSVHVEFIKTLALENLVVVSPDVGGVKRARAFAKKLGGLYGSPDAVYIARVKGTPYPNDGEAKQCIWFDVRELVITETADESKFGAQHDLLLGLYRRFLDRKFHGTHEMLTDMNDLRRSLLQIQADGWK